MKVQTKVNRPQYFSLSDDNPLLDLGTINIMVITKSICATILLAVCLSSQGQEAEQQLSAFAGRFVNSLRNQTRAQAFLITDKQVYSPKESVWFRASLIDPNMIQPDLRTHFLFVDLVNDKDSVIVISILDLPARHLNARLILPDSIRSGYYWLRAYTRTMAESDPESISLEPILIIGQGPMPSADGGKARPADDSIQLSFYPEGGSIMPGEPSIVGLQATDGNGKPLMIEGYVKDNRDSTTTKFSTNSLGLGKFEINASGYRRYRAIVNKQGKVSSFPLPVFNYRKGQVSITKVSGGYRLRALLGDSIYTKDAISYILATSKDSLIFASIGRGQYEMMLKDEQITGGICTFYLLDRDFGLLSQRSIYVPEKTNIQITSDKPVYSRREKVTLTLGVTDAAHQPVTALVSISVADSALQQLRGSCITSSLPRELNNMMLARNSCIADSMIELFMLVRSQEGFMGTLLKDTNATDMDSLLYIKGKVVNEKNEPQVQASVTLRTGTGQVLLSPYTTGTGGFFRFPVESYADSTQFLIHVESNNAKIKNTRVILDDPPYPKLVTPVWMKESIRASLVLPGGLTPSREDSMLQSNDKQMLSKATVRTRQKVTNYDASKRYSSNSTIIGPDVLTERTSVGNAVLNTGGIQILNGFLTMDGPTSLNPPDANSEPLIVVNGVSITPSGDVLNVSPALSYLNSLQSQEVEFIEILRGPQAATFGMRGGNGVIVVNLARTRKGPAEAPLNLKAFYAKGVANPSPFPMVNYEPKTAKNRVGSDTRSTLYWNSELLTGITPNKLLAFFASDRPGTYQVIVNGIGVHREIIYKTLTFRVQ